MRPGERSLARVALGISAAAIVGTHAPVIGYKAFANVDEAYALALAERLLEGQKLYVGAVSQRGPLMYYTYEAIAGALGWDNIVGLRIVALLFALAHLCLVHAFARRFIGPRATIVATFVAAYALSIGLAPYDRFALNGEFLQVPALLVAAYSATLALARARPGRPEPSQGRRRALMLASGLALGAAVSVKQSIALHALPILVFVALRAVRTRDRSQLWLGVLHVAGLVAVVSAFLLHAAASGTLGALFYYTVEYNVRTHVGAASSLWSSLPSLARELEGNPTFGLSLVVLAFLASVRAARPLRDAIKRRSVRPIARAFDVEAHVMVQLAVGVLSAAYLRRFFSHYFIPSLPFLALAVGMLGRRALTRRPAGALRTMTFALTAALFLVAGLEAYQLEKIDGRVTHDKAPLRLSAWIDATTARTDKIFVWGFSPWLYAYSHRRPAGRFVFETYPTGFVPWFHEDLEVERQRVVPGSMEALLSDLDAERPELVIDAGTVMLARSMRTYAPASAWLHAGYCFEVRVTGFDVFRRKANREATCASPFPVVQGAYDFIGRPLPVGVPRTVDEADSVWLNQADASLPAWFADAPTPPKVSMLIDRVDLERGMRLDGAKLPYKLGVAP